jgi:hypothetical protein
MKFPKVIETKLGRKKADGIMVYDENTIYIDIRLKGINKLETYIHEFMHYQRPKATEKTILKEAKEMAEFLWSHHIRFVENIKE